MVGGYIWVTKAEAAEHAKLSQRTIERWLQRGLLPYSGGGTTGEKVLIRLDQLDTFMENERGHGVGE